MLKIVCCECGVHLGNKPSDPSVDGEVTHGICESCARHFFAQLGMPLTQYLEGIQVPVVVVNDKGAITTANQKAFDLLGKTSVQIQGFDGGEVFECEYVRLPGGCGKTIHCSGCTIRNTVIDTMQTGKRYSWVPAYLEQRSDNEPRPIELFISTEKKGEFVFLRIEEMNEALPKKRMNST